jgi:hypothetical protein
MDEEETEMFESVRMENGSGKLFFLCCEGVCFLDRAIMMHSYVQHARPLDFSALLQTSRCVSLTRR